jgi:signal transduction histidine kinase
MQGVITDVLEISRFRSGAIRLQSRRFDAFELAGAVVEALRPLTEKRRHRLQLSGDPPTIVFGDYRRLERALMNLVSNAHRYTSDGGEISIDVAAIGDNVCWRVTDTGPGISRTDQRQLFERFFVGRTGQGDANEGVGLGLPMALAIAQAHGGTIEVQSEPGAGSSFSLMVPAAGPAEEKTP